MIQNVKKSYTNKEWEQREDYYKNACGALNLDETPTTTTVMALTAKIDDILSEALLDLSYIKRSYDMYKTSMTLEEKESFTILKQQQLASGNKITENDVKGLVVTYLKKKPISQNSKASIYDTVQYYSYRLAFIESVVKILTEKKAGLITDNTMLKIEANMTLQGTANNNNIDTSNIDDIPAYI